MLLEVEADQNMSNESGSLMDRVLMGMITACSMFYSHMSRSELNLNIFRKGPVD